MAFSKLPAEIHAVIANKCEKRDLFNLCLTSKWVSERCLYVLYRDVDLRFDSNSLEDDNDLDTRKQRLFVHTLLSRPEYGKYVRSLVGILRIPSLDHLSHIGTDTFSDEEFWCAMRSLSHIQKIEVGSENSFANRTTAPTQQFPTDCFRSVTSVRLLGHMQYGLAKSILDAINPATLKLLCLNVVQDHRVGIFHADYVPGTRGEDGQLIAAGATSGLLTGLTGHCTALRTLVLRRTGQIRNDHARFWHTPAEEASYIEWTSFIRSVQGTVEKLMFEQISGMTYDPEPSDGTRPFRIMDERFHRLVLPTLISGTWPRLTLLQLGGVRSSNDVRGTSTVQKELKAVLGDNVTVVVTKKANFKLKLRKVDVWE